MTQPVVQPEQMFNGLTQAETDATASVMGLVHPAAPDAVEGSQWARGDSAPSAEGSAQCDCETCRPNGFESMRFIVCATCGNKRCPHARDHRNACTNSNEVGQKGSSWEHVKPWPSAQGAEVRAGSGATTVSPLREDQRPDEQEGAARSSPLLSAGSELPRAPK